MGGGSCRRWDSNPHALAGTAVLRPRVCRSSTPRGAANDNRAPYGDNPPPVEVAERLELIRRLCSFEGRRAGTDAERRAANDLAGRAARGRPARRRRADLRPPAVGARPRRPLRARRRRRARRARVPAARLRARAASPRVSMYLDLNSRLYLVRRLFFRRASQNVVSPGARPDAPARLVLCAHYDAAQGGRAVRPAARRASRRASRRGSPFPIGPFRILFWSLALLLPILGARMAGIDAGWVSLLQLLPTLVLMLGIFLLVDIALSAVVPGRQRQRVRRRDRALAGRARWTASRPRTSTSGSCSTGGRGVPPGGHALRSCARTASELDARPPTSSASTPSALGEVRFETAAGWVGHLSRWTAGSSSSARRSRPPTARATAGARAAAPRDGAATSFPPRSAATPRPRSPVPARLDASPAHHTAADIPEPHRRRRARARPRLRARARPPARP